MSESNPMLQLSTAPSAPEPEAPAAVTESIQQTAAPAEPEAAPRLDDSQRLWRRLKQMWYFAGSVRLRIRYSCPVLPSYHLRHAQDALL